MDTDCGDLHHLNSGHFSGDSVERKADRPVDGKEEK